MENMLDATFFLVWNEEKMLLHKYIARIIVCNIKALVIMYSMAATV